MTKRNTPMVQTFGCRLNIWESEVLRDQAGVAGLSDAIIFNTCAVTAEAEKQARQAIRKARRDYPDARIIVTGCAAQIAPETWADMPEVTQVLGNHDKLKVESWKKHRIWLIVFMNIREPFCRFSKDVIIAVPFALFPMAGEITGLPLPVV